MAREDIVVLCGTLAFDWQCVLWVSRHPEAAGGGATVMFTSHVKIEIDRDQADEFFRWADRQVKANADAERLPRMGLRLTGDNGDEDRA